MIFKSNLEKYSFNMDDIATIKIKKFIRDLYIIKILLHKGPEHEEILYITKGPKHEKSLLQKGT